MPTWLLLLRSLWPAILVWLLIVYPLMAWQSYRIRNQSHLPVPWMLRVYLWQVEHIWPYTKIVRAGARYAEWEKQAEELQGRR